MIRQTWFCNSCILNTIILTFHFAADLFIIRQLMNYTIGDRELWYPLNDLYLLDDFLPIVSCIKGLTFPCHVQYQYLLSGDEDRVTAWVCKVQCTEALWISAYPYRANQFYACLVIPRYILPDKYISVLTLLSACFHSLTPWSTLFSHVIPLLIFANKFNTFIYNIILYNLYIIIN